MSVETKERKPSAAFSALVGLSASPLTGVEGLKPYKVRTSVGEFYAVAAGPGQARHAVARMLARDAVAEKLTTRDLLKAMLPPDLGDKLPAE